MITNNNDSLTMNEFRNVGDNLAILDNGNESNNNDFNPYAYPYFHSDGQSSVLYNLVIQFGSYWNAGNEFHQRRLVRRIEARCMAHPEEFVWIDSCGDTALHRLCQIARLPSSPNQWNNAKFLVQIAKAMVDNLNSATTTALNNWNETPLHQFVTHCGLPHQLLQNNNNDDNNDNLIIKQYHASKNPMLELAKILSKNGAASLLNFEQCFPLHNAVEIAQVRAGLLIDESQSSLSTSTSQSNNNTSKPIIDIIGVLRDQHADIVKLLIAAAPQALKSLDLKQKMPLLRSLRACNTRPRVVQLLLDNQNDDNNAPYNIPDFANKVGLELEACYGKRISMRIFNQINDNNNNYDNNKSLQHFLDTEMQPLWDKTVMIVSLLSDKLLHGLLKANAPACLIALAMQLYANDIMTKDIPNNHNNKMSFGKLPLEIYLESGGRYNDQTLQLLLQSANNKYNNIACTICSNGQHPLHLALTKQYPMKCIQRLVQAAPNIVAELDVLTNLYPFQLAARYHEQQLLQQQYDGQKQLLSSEQICTMIFHLLQSDPSVLTHHI